jgi:hypothetical protein
MLLIKHPIASLIKWVLLICPFFSNFVNLFVYISCFLGFRAAKALKVNPRPFSNGSTRASISSTG